MSFTLDRIVQENTPSDPDMSVDIQSTEPLLEQYQPGGSNERHRQQSYGLSAALGAAFFFSCIINVILMGNLLGEVRVNFFPKYFYCKWLAYNNLNLNHKLMSTL